MAYPKKEKSPDKTGKKLVGNEATQFKKGESGNPTGRPKGARSKLTTKFFEDFHEAWAEHGKPALREAVERDPIAFVNAAARLMPKEVDVDMPKVERFAGFQFIVSGKNENAEDQK
jgi:hypothetical protein